MQNWKTNFFRKNASPTTNPYPNFKVLLGDATHVDSLIQSEVCAWVAEAEVKRCLQNGYKFYLDTKSGSGLVRHDASELGARTSPFSLMKIPVSEDHQGTENR